MSILDRIPLVRVVKKIAWWSLAYIIVVLFSFFLGVQVSQIGKQRAYYRQVMDDLELISQISMEQQGDQQSILSQFKTNDIRVANLKYFFRKYNSVLYDYADVFVQKADQYKLDYRLLPAIAMQESNLCAHIYEGSYNCWGWGIYGNKVTRFSSYPEAIDTISRGIKANYIDKGLTSPEAIMRKYTPPSDGSWAFGVNTFLKIIE